MNEIDEIFKEERELYKKPKKKTKFIVLAIFLLMTFVVCLIIVQNKQEVESHVATKKYYYDSKYDRLFNIKESDFISEEDRKDAVDCYEKLGKYKTIFESYGFQIVIKKHIDIQNNFEILGQMNPNIKQIILKQKNVKKHFFHEVFHALLSYSIINNVMIMDKDDIKHDAEILTKKNNYFESEDQEEIMAEVFQMAMDGENINDFKCSTIIKGFLP